MIAVLETGENFDGIVPYLADSDFDHTPSLRIFLNRVKEWVPFLKQCCVVEMIANFPRFFEPIRFA